MLELPTAQPLPAPCQVQVLAQLVELDVGVEQRRRARAGGQVPRRDEGIVNTQAQAGDVASHDVAVFARKLRRVRHQPLQQFARPRVHHHGRA